MSSPFVSETDELVTHYRVRFHGQEYWLNGWLLAPLDHFDEHGNLLTGAFLDVSYAVLSEDGDIMRHGCKIGTIADLEFEEAEQ